MRAAIFILIITLSNVVYAADPVVSFEQRDGSLAIRVGDAEVASYVFRDERVPHPYFSHVKTLGGVQVTRHHPPRQGQDSVDHAGLHTGIWLSFGDLNGNDYWRLKGRTEHVKFVEEPAGTSGRGGFAVLNRYLTADGKGTVCEEACRYTIRVVPHGYLIDISSEFRPGNAELVFGDQEEMGLGIRMATPLAVDRKQGARILDSAGRRNGAEVWGKTADWCDYAGPLDGKWVGMTVFAGRENFRPCWSHARDYGFVALNPFGRKAFTKQEASRVVVKPSESLLLHYGVAVHESATEAEYQPAQTYRDFNGESKATNEPIYLAVGHGGHRMTSKDGLTWENHAEWGKPGHDQNDLNVAVNFKGTFYAGGGYSLARIAATRDGVNWSEGVLPRGSPIFGFEILDGTLYVVTLRGQVYATTDGETFEQIGAAQMPTPTHWIRSTASGNGLVVGSGDYGPALVFNPKTKAITITQMVGQTDKNATWKRVAFGNGIFVVGGQAGLLAATRDGKTWLNTTTQLDRGDVYCVEWTGREFLATTNQSALTSKDGLEWKPIADKLPRQIREVNGWLYGYSWPPSKLSRSRDGLSWEPVPNPKEWQGKSYAFGMLTGGPPPKLPVAEQRRTNPASQK